MANENPYMPNDETSDDAMSLVMQSYENLLRGLRGLKDAMRKGLLRDVFNCTDMIYSSIDELCAVANRAGSEMATKLVSLYVYWTQEVVGAVAYNDPDRLNPVITNVETIATAWAKVSEKIRANRNTEETKDDN